MVVLVGRDYQWFYKRTTISGTKELPNLFFYKHHENLPSSKWRDILGRVLGKYLCDWGSLKERCCWGWDWKSRLILKCRWPPVPGALLSPAVVGRRGWFWSRAVFHFSWITCFSCSSDLRAVTSPNDGCPHHLCTSTRTPATVGYLVFQSPWGCRRGGWCRWQPRQNAERAGTSRSAGNGLVSSRLRGMEISDVGAEMLRMLAEGKERGQDAACRQREESPLPAAALGLAPRKGAAGHFSKVCFYLLTSPPVADFRWLESTPLSFACLVLYLPYFANSYLLGVSRDVAERKERGRILMDGCKWKLRGIWSLGDAVPVTSTRDSVVCVPGDPLG